MINLQRFYNDEATRKDVRDFLIEYLKEKAVELTFNGDETKHIKLAGEVISEAWNKLDQIYGKKEQKQKENQAR